MKKQATQQRQAQSLGAAVAEVRATGRTVTPLRQMVLVLAARRCNEFNDSPAARQDMKRAVLDTPPELLADLHAALLPIAVEMGTANESTTTQE